MNVIYCPSTARKFNDQMSLNREMQYIMKEARKHQKFRSLTIHDPCELCDHWACHNHHIKPVWAYALEWLLNNNIQNRGDVSSLIRYFYENSKQFAFWHSPDNIMLLCAECHKNTQSKVNSEYKKYFEENYPVIFGYRRLKEQEALLEKTIMTHSDALVTL